MRVAHRSLGLVFVLGLAVTGAAAADVATAKPTTTAPPTKATKPAKPKKATKAAAPPPRVTSTGRSYTPDELRYIDKVNEQLGFYTEALTSACDIPLEIEWDSFVDANRCQGQPTVTAAACRGAVWAATERCKETVGREALRLKVSRVRCEHIDDKQSTGVFVEGDALVVRIHVNDTGTGDVPPSAKAPDRGAVSRFLDRALLGSP